MTEQFDSEERALRDALAGEAESVQFEPLAASDLPRRGPAGRGWSTGVAAAVVIGLVAVLAAGVLPYLRPSGTSAAASAPAGGQEPQVAPAEASPESAPGPDSP
ncbi:MAG: hypothetical protein AAGC63_02610, partial [Propionicimonas sp.]|nr:hypothetical protein [Propionicimonas sp.]